jgi:ActR/RegA family two-component response regulator
MGLESNTPDEQAVAQRQSPELTKRILVVEDDPSVQKTLKRLFEAEGFAVRGTLTRERVSTVFTLMCLPRPY